MLDTIEKSKAATPALLEGLLTEDQIKSALGGCGERTLRRRENEGLPVIIIGRTRFYPEEKCRAWLLSRTREQAAPRRGRPRKLNAA